MLDLTHFQQQVRTVGRMLKYSGYDAADFEIEADRSSPLAQMFKLSGGVMVVRRRSTGEERVYTSTADSGWVDTLMSDLAQGALADPPQDGQQQPS